MRATERYPSAGRYVITEAGRLGLLTGDDCRCNPKMVGLLFECCECGTVYGSLRNWKQEPPRFDRKPD